MNTSSLAKAGPLATILLLCCAAHLPVVVLALAGVAGTANAQVLWDGQDPQLGPAGIPSYSTHVGSICYTVHFEGNGSGVAPLSGQVPGTPIEFASSYWFTLQGSPFVQNNPSGDTIAFLFGSNTGEITLSQPASRASFYYASTSPVTLEVLDATNTVLGSDSGPANFLNGFTVWTELSVDLGVNSFVKIRATGASGGVGLDDLDVCYEVTREVGVEVKPLNNVKAINVYNIGSQQHVTLGVYSEGGAEPFDATTIDYLTCQLGDPNLAGRVTAISMTVADLNDDDLPDVVLDFGPAEDFGAAGAFDGNTTQAELTGQIPHVDIHGVGDVTIVGGP